MDKPKLIVKAKPAMRVKVKKIVSIRPDDYEKLKNLPSINGLELVGSLTSDELKLLSAVLANYKEKSLPELPQESNYLLVMGESKKYRVSLKDLYAAISAVDTGSKIILDGEGDLEIALRGDVFYQIGSKYTSLSISFTKAENGRVNEYNGKFKTGDSVPTVTFPAGIAWVGEGFPELEANKTYQFSVLNNVGVVVAV